MQVRKIRLLPDPVLRKKAKKVPSVDKGIQELIDDMIETLHKARGAGLAAPQVGVSLRIVVIQEPEKEPLCLVNPEIVKRSGERVIEEGCLSIPGYRGMVKRSEQVTVKAHDRSGKEIRIKAEGLLGQAIEHECDHLEGVLYIDRLTDKKTLRKIDEETGEDEDLELHPVPAKKAKGETESAAAR
jgi:peptide deformylase